MHPVTLLVRHLVGPLLGDRLVGLFQEVSVQKVGGVMFVDIVADKLGGHRAGSFISVVCIYTIMNSRRNTRKPAEMQ